jgi:hypothetical protein
MKVSVMGLAWFRREDYRTLKSLFADGTGLHPSYDEWLKAAEGMFEQLKRQGIETHKVYIDPEEFPAWCKANGLNIERLVYGSPTRLLPKCTSTATDKPTEFGVDMNSQFVPDLRLPPHPYSTWNSLRQVQQQRCKRVWIRSGNRPVPVRHRRATNCRCGTQECVRATCFSHAGLSPDRRWVFRVSYQPSAVNQNEQPYAERLRMLPRTADQEPHSANPCPRQCSL